MMQKRIVYMVWFVVVSVWQPISMMAQKRCYTYDAAGCRILRDQSCDPTCSTVVSNTNDSGIGSLRKAIECAENGDTITFALAMTGQIVQLTSGPIQINKDIHIIQDVQVGVSSNTRTLQVNTGATELQYITIYAGCYNGYAGTAIRNYGDMVLRDVIVIQDDDPNCGAASVFNLGNLTIQGQTQIIKQ